MTGSLVFQSIGAGNRLSSFLGCKVKVSATCLATDSAERKASQKLAKELAVERERSATLEKRSSELFEQVSSYQSSLDESRMQLEALDKRFA